MVNYLLSMDQRMLDELELLSLHIVQRAEKNGFEIREDYMAETLHTLSETLGKGAHMRVGFDEIAHEIMSREVGIAVHSLMTAGEVSVSYSGKEKYPAVLHTDVTHYNDSDAYRITGFGELVLKNNQKFFIEALHGEPVAKWGLFFEGHGVTLERLNANLDKMFSAPKRN
jgi:hypothetical protein